jgi:hypothetical protein
LVNPITGSAGAEGTGVRRGRWWQFGLVGGLVLTLATLAKAVAAIPRFFTENVPWSEVAVLPLAVFGMVFVCGVVVWAVRSVTRRYGPAGDAMVGVIVMNVFFLMCMALFEPAMLSGDRPGAESMLGLATVIGLVAGPWIGRDFRRAPPVGDEPGDDGQG